MKGCLAALPVALLAGLAVMPPGSAQTAEPAALHESRCTGCHGSAASFARVRLAIPSGRLVGRYSGREVGSFVQDHGRLDAAQRAQIIPLLEQQLTQGG